MILKVKRINETLFYLLLFFGLFDSARNYTLLPTWFGYIKDIAIFGLIMINIIRISLPVHNRNLMLLQCLYWFLGGLMGIVYSNGYSVIKIMIGIAKYLEFFLFILLFYNWDRLFSVDIRYIADQYVTGSCLIVPINLIGCFVPNPIVHRTLANSSMTAPEFYGSRISLGQPPIVALPMIFSCLYLLWTGKRDKKSIIKLLILTVGILGCVTMTGIAAVAICGLFYVIVVSLSGRKKEKRKLFLALSSVFFLVWLFGGALNNIFKEQIGLFSYRILNYLSGKDGAMNGRDVHANYVLGLLKDCFQWLLGRGMYGFNINGNYQYIENTYISMLCTYGILGLGMFLLFLIRIVLYDINEFLKKKNRIYLLGVCVCGVYFLHMYTLDVLIIYTVTFGFTFFNAVVYKTGREARWYENEYRICIRQ